ncbi:MAG: hypothetical protein JXB48_14225 [Candidatus Latescibacteria bacterium]|nr:hypothetical protein [Candidatus Latescibacterota bacterium]
MHGRRAAGQAAVPAVVNIIPDDPEREKETCAKWEKKEFKERTKEKNSVIARISLAGRPFYVE